MYSYILLKKQKKELLHETRAAAPTNKLYAIGFEHASY